MKVNDLYPSKYLKAEDIKGRPPVSVVIAKVTMEELGEGDNKQLKPILYFQGKERGLALNKTNANMIAHTFGNETDDWVGKTILLRSEPVDFKGKIVDAIRVSAGQAEVYANEQQATEANIQQEVVRGFDDQDIPF